MLVSVGCTSDRELGRGAGGRPLREACFGRWAPLQPITAPPAPAGGAAKHVLATILPLARPPARIPLHFSALCHAPTHPLTAHSPSITPLRVTLTGAGSMRLRTAVLVAGEPGTQPLRGAIVRSPAAMIALDQPLAAAPSHSPGPLLQPWRSAPSVPGPLRRRGPRRSSAQSSASTWVSAGMQAPLLWPLEARGGRAACRTPAAGSLLLGCCTCGTGRCWLARPTAESESRRPSAQPRHAAAALPYL